MAAGLMEVERLEKVVGGGIMDWNGMNGHERELWV